MILFYQGEICDGRGEVVGTRLFALYADNYTGVIQPTNPAILWDLKEGTLKPAAENEIGEQNIENLKHQTWNILLPGLEKYRQDLLDERERQAAIKEKYGVKSLEGLILKLDGDLIRLYDRRERGESVELAIRNKEEQKAGYESALQNLQLNLAREQNLTLSMPHFLCAVRVVPAPVGAVEGMMVSDVEVEKIGMKVTMEYERNASWSPEDVSTQNLGFDVRSTGSQDKKRYIEVKARASVGPVSLTQNEWFKAQRFREDYFLYVVLNASKQPELYRIQNPAAVLQPDEQMEVRYLVTVGEIIAKGNMND